MKNILVLGSSGMLGYGVSEYFSRHNYNVTKISRAEFDVLKSDIEVLSGFVNNSDLVINCIGIIKPMIAKNSELDVIKINGIFPRNLAMMCKKLNVKMVHVATDCVYTGRKGNYTELDYYDAEDLYGISKNCGDISECLVLRTSLIGPENGTQRSLLEWAFLQKGKSANGFTNHKWNGVSTIYFAEVVENIILNNLYKEGIFHLGSPDVVTKYELLKIFNDVFNLNMTITPVESSEYCDRSLSSIDKLASTVCTKTIEQQVRELKVFFSL
jgi:dTDP-4-dehydrorhamnose reductase